jgi:hypothetical protein
MVRCLVSARPGPFERTLDALSRRWDAIDGVLFAAFASACVLYAATLFYGAMLVQTRGQWSAPLDDVFIHFDYARATARGYPFEWSEGNGYSSGNTSLSYPFVLALGWLGGFHGADLMRWAAFVACLSIVVFLGASARLVAGFGRSAKYLLPPALLSLGALDWSLFSGMENAFHLATWAAALVTTLDLAEACRGRREQDFGRPPPSLERLAWRAGLAGALLFVTRPESFVCVAAFAGYVIAVARRPRGLRRSIALAARLSSPGALAAALQLGANRLFTGEWSQAGAITKLAINNPYMTSQEKWDDYWFLVRYVRERLTEHHFTSDKEHYAWLAVWVALVPFFDRRTRGFAALLWVQIVAWLYVVALNGQVRWQNERYTMPAVAWLFILAGAGLAVLVQRAGTTLAARGFWAARVAFAGWLCFTFVRWQAPNFRDQVWFFARACRNIRDQHMVAGKRLAALAPRRVLVGDAGALLYVADRPGLDLIGLGGYRDLPFARAGVHGLGASIELLERMPARDRPDVMAIYPSWWGELPTLFGTRIDEVPVLGNVICGGSEKVLYRADWSALDPEGAPRSLRRGEGVVDELDVADLVNEKEHGYAFPHPQAGFVDFRVLSDPADRSRDLFDAGRVIPEGRTETARVLAPEGRGRLVVRTAAAQPAKVEVRADGAPIGRLEITPDPRDWSEPSIELPAGLRERFELSLTPVEGEWTDYHAWIVEPAPSR